MCGMYNHVFDDGNATTQCRADREKQINHAYDGRSVAENKNLPAIRTLNYLLQARRLYGVVWVELRFFRKQQLKKFAEFGDVTNSSRADVHKSFQAATTPLALSSNTFKYACTA